MNIKIDKEHPLFVYSPCGVGGSPGGTAFGLKEVFGDAVHIFYVEPIYFPAVLIGLATGEMSNISVKDLGLDYQTEADGLAVGRPSKFATEISDEIISGIFTIEDDDLFRLLAHLKDSEDIFVEPSAAAGLIGPQIIGSSGYLEKHNINPDKITHLAWSTGGDLVPTKNRKEFYQRGKDLLNSR